VQFQISQRADHIVNDIYQWVQFNTARSSTHGTSRCGLPQVPPSAPAHRRFEHEQYATALKVGTTSLVLDLLEEGILPKRVGLMDPVQATRDISRDPHYRWIVRLENGQTRTAMEIQHSFLGLAKHYLAGMDPENDWIIREWEAILDGLERDPMSQTDKIDWVAKKWMLQMFLEQEHLGWDDPWLQSLDLEYHNLDPRRGLYFALEQQGRAQHVVTSDASRSACKIRRATRGRKRAASPSAIARPGG